jgi:uncharacterized membrane protein
MPAMTEDSVSKLSAQITRITRDQSQSVDKAKKAKTAKRYRAISSVAVLLGIHVVYGVPPQTGTSGSNAI